MIDETVVDPCSASPPRQVLVTGASGFIGRALCARLAGAGCQVTGAVRAAGRSVADGVVARAIGPIESADWATVLPSHDAVVHLAAHVHRMQDASPDTAGEYRRVNHDATVRLARAAAIAGVRRFVFVSSIKVCGEATAAAPFGPDCEPRPADPYGESKWEAERSLRLIAAETAMAVTIVRPPLVYGPGVGANFLRMMRAVDRGIPLPLASVRNRRSLVFVDNLADFIACCLWHPAAAGRTFTVSDGDDPSTPELLAEIASALGVPCRLWRFPPRLLRILASLAGKRTAADRLIDSLQVDPSAATELLGWLPPNTRKQGLEVTARWYRSASAAGADQ